MNNLIKAQWFMFKKIMLMASIGLIILIIYFTISGTLSGEKAGYSINRQSLSINGLFGISLAVIIPGGFFTSSYIFRLHYYEIMAGFSPNQIIGSRAAIFTPVILVFYYIPTACIFLICNPNIEMLQALVLFLIILLKVILCTVFLSPYFKSGTMFVLFIPILTLVPKGLFNSLEAYQASPFRFTTGGMCSILGTDITVKFTAEVIIMTIIECVISYLIGYYSLKRKVDQNLNSLDFKL